MRFTGTGNIMEKGACITVLGMPRVGKSSLLGVLHIHLVDKANRKELRYRVHEYQKIYAGKYVRVLGQRQSASEMREGKFPPPTPEDLGFEADATIVFPKKIMGRQVGESTVNVPWLDLAGEDTVSMVEDLSRGIYDIPALQSAGKELHEKILQANGFIVTLNTANMLVGDKRFEGWDSPLKQDVTMSHILEVTYDYKNKYRGQGPAKCPITALSVVLTQCDKVSNILAGLNIDLLKTEGIHEFMSTQFPETYSTLNFYGVPIKYIPMYIEQVFDNGKPVLYDPAHVDLGYKIKTDPYTHIPSYNKEGIEELIAWIRENFGS